MSDSNKKQKIEYSNGDIYEGQLVNGLREGYGQFTYANKDVYVGEFSENYRHGKG